MPKAKAIVGLLSFDDLEAMDVVSSGEALAAPPRHYYPNKYTRCDTKEGLLWQMFHSPANPYDTDSNDFALTSDEVSDHQLLESCGDCFGISGGNHGLRRWSADYVGGTKPRIGFTSPGILSSGVAHLVHSNKPDDRVYSGKRLADLIRLVLWGPVVKADNYYCPDKYVGQCCLDACLWHALHCYDKGGVSWGEISPDVTDDVLQEMVCRVFQSDGYFLGNGWNFATKVEKGYPLFVAIDEARRRFGEQDSAQAVIDRTGSTHHSLYRGQTLLDLVRFVLWGPPLQSPESVLHQARQALVQTFTGVLERKKELEALVRTETATITAEERPKIGACQPGFMKGISQPPFELEGKLYVTGSTAYCSNSGVYHEQYEVFQVVPLAQWSAPSHELYDKKRDGSFWHAPWQWQGIRIYQTSIKGKSAVVKDAAYVLTGYVLRLILPPQEYQRWLEINREKRRQMREESEAKPEPEPVAGPTDDLDAVANVDPRVQTQPAPEPEEPVSPSLPPAPLTVNGTTCTTHDADGNSAMLSFAHAVKAAGYGNQITTCGKLDARKCCRACNALVGRVASDKPQPAIDEWYQAAKAVKASSGDGFDEIAALESLPCDEQDATA